MITKHQLYSQKLSGCLILVYEDGLFKSLVCEFKEPMKPGQFEALKNAMPLDEKDISMMGNIGFVASVGRPDKTNEKIAVFCRAYFHYKKVKYKVSAADSGKMKHVQITDEILVNYFTSKRFEIKDKHSIANLCKYYNELLADMAKGKRGLAFPDGYDEKFHKTLTPDQVPAYWKHLREHNWVFENGRWKVREKI